MTRTHAIPGSALALLMFGLACGEPDVRPAALEELTGRSSLGVRGRADCGPEGEETCLEVELSSTAASAHRPPCPVFDVRATANGNAPVETDPGGPYEVWQGSFSTTECGPVTLSFPRDPSYEGALELWVWDDTARFHVVYEPPEQPTISASRDAAAPGERVEVVLSPPPHTNREASVRVVGSDGEAVQVGSAPVLNAAVSFLLPDLPPGTATIRIWLWDWKKNTPPLCDGPQTCTVPTELFRYTFDAEAEIEVL